MASRSAAGGRGRVVLWGTAFAVAGSAVAWIAITDRAATAQERKGNAPRVAPERMEQVRELILSDDARKLEQLGPAANDAYLAILKDETSDLFDLGGYRILDLLAAQKGDRSPFLPVARKLLSNMEAGYRGRAAVLLGEIGGATDAPLLVPLLSDEGDGVQVNAAHALARIGTPKELDALDRLLAPQYPDDDNDVLVRLIRARDQLRKRLVAEKRVPPKKENDPPVDPGELKRVWDLLRRHRSPPDELEKAGPVLNPVYLVILADPRAGRRECDGILWLLSRQKGDRTPFVPVAGKLLRHPDAGVRGTAADLLGVIGGPADASLLVPLLSDEHGSVQYEAGPALARIGTATELEALDRRLKTKHPADSPEVLAELRKSRDRLKERLEAEKAAPRK